MKRAVLLLAAGTVAAVVVATASSPAPQAAPRRTTAICPTIDGNALAATPYVFQYGVSGSDLQSEFFDKKTGLNAKGYRPVRLLGYRSGDEQRFATKWIKAGGPQWLGKYGLDSGGFHTLYLALRSLYRPTDVSGYMTPGGNVRYAVIWERNTAGLTWKVHRDVSRSGMQDLVDDYSESGFVPVRVDSYLRAGAASYVSIWVKDSCPWRMHNKMTREDYQQKLEAYWDDGYRLVSLDEFTEGARVYYAGIWWKQPGPSQAVRSNRDWYLFQRLFNNNKCRSRVIHDFYVSDVLGTVRYGGIWTSTGAEAPGPDSALGARVAQEVECAPGRAGAAVINLTTGDEVLVHADAPYGTSSSIKSAILYTILRRLDRTSENLNTTIDVGSQYGTNQGGTLTPNQRFSIQTLVTTMIQNSNNWATNRLIDWLGGFNPVNIEVAVLGFPSVRLGRYMTGPGSPIGNAYVNGRDNTATPRQFAGFLRRVHQNNGLLTQASWTFFWTTLGLNANAHDAVLDSGVGTNWPTVVGVAEKAGSNSWSAPPSTKPQLGAHLQRSNAGRLLFTNGNVVFYAALVDEADSATGAGPLQNMLDCVVMQAVREFATTSTGADVPACAAD